MNTDELEDETESLLIDVRFVLFSLSLLDREEMNGGDEDRRMNELEFKRLCCPVVLVDVFVAGMAEPTDWWWLFVWLLLEHVTDVTEDEEDKSPISSSMVVCFLLYMHGCLRAW